MVHSLANAFYMLQMAILYYIGTVLIDNHEIDRSTFFM